MDYLAAADVIAAERAKARGHDVTETDIEAAFSAECFWPPYKPAVRGWIKVRALALQEAYTSNKKRTDIRKAIGPALLKAEIEDLSVMFKKGISEDEFKEQIIDYSQLIK